METYQKIIIIVGITEAIKQYGIPSAFNPTIAIIIGAVLGFIEQPDPRGVFAGLILGASITGVYAVIKRAARALLSPFKKEVRYESLEADDYRGV